MKRNQKFNYTDEAPKCQGLDNLKWPGFKF